MQHSDTKPSRIARAFGSLVATNPSRRRGAARCSIAALALPVLWAAASFAVAETQVPDDPAARTPEQQVRKASDEVLALIEQSRGYAKEEPERFFREVERLLRPVVDFDSFARSVMAVHYRDASDAQRERFADTFRWGLVRTYALALTEFNDGEVVVVPPDRPPRSERRRTVKMEIRTSAGEVYPVLYSMGLDKDGVWRVRNIIVNGINMGLTYRSQFASAMNDQQYGGDMDKVIDAWADLLAAEADDDAEIPENSEASAPDGPSEVLPGTSASAVRQDAAAPLPVSGV